MRRLVVGCLAFAFACRTQAPVEHPEETDDEEEPAAPPPKQPAPSKPQLPKGMMMTWEESGKLEVPDPPKLTAVVDPNEPPPEDKPAARGRPAVSPPAEEWIVSKVVEVTASGGGVRIVLAANRKITVGMSGYLVDGSQKMIKGSTFKIEKVTDGGAYASVGIGVDQAQVAKRAILK